MRRGGPRICSFRLQVHFTPLQLLLTFFGGRTVNKARLSPNLGRVTSVTTEEHDTGCWPVVCNPDSGFAPQNISPRWWGSLLTSDRWIRERSEIRDRGGDDKRDCCCPGTRRAQFSTNIYWCSLCKIMVQLDTLLVTYFAILTSSCPIH